MKITKKMTMEAYSYAKKVYEEILEREKALNYLERKDWHDRNSAADYIQNFKCMMNGKKYSRTNSIFHSS